MNRRMCKGVGADPFIFMGRLTFFHLSRIILHGRFAPSAPILRSPEEAVKRKINSEDAGYVPGQKKERFL